MPIRDLVVNVRANDDTASGFDSAAKNAEDSGGRMRRMGGVAAAAFAATGVGAVAAGKAVFDHGAKLQQMQAKAETVFGTQVGQVDKWASKNAAAMGLTRREARGLATDFADLLIPMGFNREQAAKMSTDVVGLSGALSQWSGGTKSAAEVADILSAAMLGETDGLKALGISISAADIQARLAAKGQDKLTGAALAQAQAVATQELILEKSKDAQTAYASGGAKMLQAQNKAKVAFREAWDELSVRLVPILTKLAEFAARNLPPAIAAVTGALSGAGAVIGVVTGAIGGLVDFIQANQTTFTVVAAIIGTVLVPALIAMGVQATIAGGKAAAAWLAQQLAAARATAVLVISYAATAAGWVTMGVQAMANAARIAAAWLISIGPVALVVAAVVGLAVVVAKNWEKIRRFIVDKARAVMGWLRDNWPLILAILTGPIGLAVLAIAKKWDTIKAGASAVKDWIVGKFNAVVGFLSGLPGRIGSAVKGMFEPLYGAFRGAVRKIVELWNSLDFGFKVKLPGWLGGKSFGIDDVIPDIAIPGLYRGGTATSDGLAVVGERGPELLRMQRGASVVPLDKARATIGSPSSDALLRELIAATRENTAAVMALRRMNRQDARSGRALVTP